MDQDATWYGGRPWPRPHCVRWRPSSFQQPPPLFSPCELWPNGCMDQDSTWYGGRPRPRPSIKMPLAMEVCLGRPFLGGSWRRSYPQKKGTPAPAQVPIEHKVAWAEAYLHTKWHLSPSSRLVTMDIGRKLGALSLQGRELGPHLTQCHVGQGQPTSIPIGILIHAAVWPQ